MGIGKMIGIGIGALVALIVLSSFFGSFYRIDEGERGIILTNGAVSGIAEPGLGYKLPFIQTVQEISLRQGVASWDSNGPLMTYSYDQQVAAVTLSVNYRVEAGQVLDVYKRYGNVDNLVQRTIVQTVPESMKAVFGQFTAAKIVQERERLNAAIQEAIIRDINGPITIDSIQVTNIDFSDAYENAIEAKMTAEVAVLQERQRLEKEKVNAEITVTQAKATADSVLAQRTAEAEGVKLLGNAEAEAIRVKGAALRDNPSLISLVQAEKWNGTLPTTMVPSGTVPFLNVNPQ